MEQNRNLSEPLFFGEESSNIIARLFSFAISSLKKPALRFPSLPFASLPFASLRFPSPHPSFSFLEVAFRREPGCRRAEAKRELVRVGCLRRTRVYSRPLEEGESSSRRRRVGAAYSGSPYPALLTLTEGALMIRHKL